MKHFFLKVWKTPMFLIFILISVFFGLPALGKPTEIDRFAVVTAIGIDRAQEEEYNYELSFLTFIPIAEQNFTETYKVISAKGKSFAEALDYAGLYIGREVGLSHLRTVVLNQELFDDDVSNVLDYLTRDKEVPSSTKLIATDSSAKDFLNAVQMLDSESSIKVSEIVTSNQRYLYATDSTLESFFKGYFSPTGACVISVFSLQENDEQGLSVSNTQSQNSTGGSSGGQEGEGENASKQIVNSGETLIMKKGYLQRSISGQEIAKLNYFRGNFNTGAITIDNFTENDFKNASLTFNIFDKKIKSKVKFENGIPVVYTDIKFTVVLSEVSQEEGMFDENVDLYIITKKAANEIEKKIKSDMAEGVAIMRETKTDVADFYTKMHNTGKKSFKRFLDSLDDKDDYLEHILFKTRVRVYSR